MLQTWSVNYSTIPTLDFKLSWIKPIKVTHMHQWLTLTSNHTDFEIIFWRN